MTLNFFSMKLTRFKWGSTSEKHCLADFAGNCILLSFVTFVNKGKGATTTSSGIYPGSMKPKQLKLELKSLQAQSYCTHNKTRINILCVASYLLCNWLFSIYVPINSLVTNIHLFTLSDINGIVISNASHAKLYLNKYFHKSKQ